MSGISQEFQIPESVASHLNQPPEGMMEEPALRSPKKNQAIVQAEQGAPPRQTTTREMSRESGDAMTREHRAMEPLELDERGLYKLVNSTHEMRMAKMMLETKAVPSAFKTPQQVVMAIQALKSLGLNWRTAIRQCGFSQQGAFMVYGDLELAVVRQSGLLEDLHEFLYVRDEASGKLVERCFANSNLHLPAEGAVCIVKRKGMPRPYEQSFSIDDAKLSGLWGKTPTWRQFPSRMMTMRARSMALRGSFPDISQGLAGVEYDAEGIDYSKH